MATPCYEKVIYGVDVSDLGSPQTAVLPFTSSHQLLSDVVYGDDEVQPLYTENTLTLETVLYNEVSDVTDIEAECTRIAKILKTPSLQLKIYPVGLGQIATVNVSQPDAKGGPFPQSVVVEPIASNNAILVRWTVMFRTIECPNPLGVNLLQYNVEQDMNVDDDGNMEFTTNITYQTVTPITDPQTHVNITNFLIRRVGKSFQGMTKKKRTSLSRDQRIMSIRIVFKEIESDNAYFPCTSNIEVTDSLESDLLGTSILSGIGFYSWKRDLSIRIRLPARVHKLYAHIVALKILRARFKKLYPFSKLAAIFDIDPPTAQENPTLLTDQYYYPLRIKITNPIYSREMSMDVTYVVVSDLDNLLNASKIYSRVNTGFVGAEEESEPTELSDQWEAWQNSRDHRLNGRFQYTLDGTPIVYNQCTGTHSSQQVGANRVLDLEEDPDWDGYDDGDLTSGVSCTVDLDNNQARDIAYPELKYGDDLDVANSWVAYDNDFEIIEEVNNVNVSYLEQPSSDYYKSNVGGGGDYSNRVWAGMTLHGKTANASQSFPNTVIDRGHSTFYVRMKGYAIRLGSKIPLPFVETVAGNPVKRHTAKASHKQIATGDIPVYLAKWDIVYVVEGGDIYSTDILNTIVSTGGPAHYK